MTKATGFQRRDVANMDPHDRSKGVSGVQGELRRYRSLKLNLTAAYLSPIYCLVIVVNSCIQSLLITAPQLRCVAVAYDHCSICVA
jgi:hypothetical protein